MLSWKRIELKNMAELARPTVRTLGTTLLLNVSSTTEPIRHCIGSVVELMFNSPNNTNRLIISYKELFVSALIYMDHNMVFTLGCE